MGGEETGQMVAVGCPAATASWAAVAAALAGGVP
jgi:hypothetical protein